MCGMITGFVRAVKGKTKKVQEGRRLMNQRPGMAVALGQADLHGAGGAAKAPYFACLKYIALGSSSTSIAISLTLGRG